MNKTQDSPVQEGNYMDVKEGTVLRVENTQKSEFSAQF
jgi:hypothetical protein